MYIRKGWVVGRFEMENYTLGRIIRKSKGVCILSYDSTRMKEI